ncbi:MAG: hypothetical protein AABW47_01770 [Nanoarchaeota archaeon]
MPEEFDLKKLKEIYEKLKVTYNLPLFEKVNEDFQIEKIAGSETDFIIRETRKYITDKFFSYLRFLESILTPTNAPMFVFAITKSLGVREREKLIELYKKIAKIEVDVIELDLEYSEKKEAEAIKKYYELWQEVKKELLEIVGVIKKNWDNKLEGNGNGYFG